MHTKDIAHKLDYKILNEIQVFWTDDQSKTVILSHKNKNIIYVYQFLDFRPHLRD